MKTFAALLLACGLTMATGPGGISRALAQDAAAPCGRDDNGDPLVCSRPDPGMDLEAACTTTGRPQNCVPYYQNNCARGFALACRMYDLGKNCAGGDPQTCNYFLSLTRANTKCSLDRDQAACAYLQQQVGPGQ